MAWMLSGVCAALGQVPGSSQPLLIANQGQWDPRIAFLSPFSQGKILFDREGISILSYQAAESQVRGPHSSPDMGSLRGHHLRFSFPQPSVLEPGAALASHFNFYLGVDRQKWAKGVRAYPSLTYGAIAPGIACHVSTHSGNIKYTLELAPWVRLDTFAIRLSGADSLYLSGDSLHIRTPFFTLVETPPIAFQWKGDQKIFIPCRFKLKEGGYGFEAGENYDPSRPLWIDPEWIFSTYSGALADNWGYTATYDQAGHGYAGGVVITLAIQDTDFPVTPGAFQSRFAGGLTDMVIARFSPDGRNLLYATYLGGQDEDQPHSMVAGDNGRLWIMGRSLSLDYPVTPDAYDPIFNGRFDLVVSQLDTEGGELMASTYIGGNGDDGVNISKEFATYGGLKYNYGDDARGEIILDEAGNCYVAACTRSGNFPTTTGSFQPRPRVDQEGCVFSLNGDLSALRWSSFLGGNGEDAAYGISKLGNRLYVCGGTNSPDFPGTIGGWMPTFQGGTADGFVASLALDGSVLNQSSYLGTGEYDQAFLIAHDQDGHIFLLGQSMGDFPVISSNPGSNMFQVAGGRQFVMALASSLQEPIFSTRVGSPNSEAPNISPTAFMVDSCQRIFLAGWGGLTNHNANPLAGPFGGFTDDMPITADALQKETDGSDMYFMVLGKQAERLIFGSYLGGDDLASGEHVDGGTSRFSPDGTIYHIVCAGCRGTSAFPATPGSWSTLNGSLNCNMALVKIRLNSEELQADFDGINQVDSAINKGCAPLTLDFSNHSQPVPGPQTQIFWDFGDRGLTSLRQNPRHTFRDPGTYTVTLILTDSSFCEVSDTARQTIVVYPPPELSLTSDTTFCLGDSVVLKGTPGLVMAWAPNRHLKDTGSSSTLAAPKGDITYRYTLTDSLGCTQTDSVTLSVLKPPLLSATPDTVVCPGEAVALIARGADSYAWYPPDSVDDPTSNMPLAAIHVSQELKVVGTLLNGCRDSLRIRLGVQTPQSISWQTIDPSCDSAWVSLEVAGGDRYNWSHGAAEARVKVPWALGEIWVEADAACPANRLYLNLDSLAQIPAPVAAMEVISSGEIPPVQIQTRNLSRHAKGFVWEFGDGSLASTDFSPAYEYARPGTYWLSLVAVGENGCTDTIRQKIRVAPVQIFVPTGFSPNGDQHNDLFEIQSQGVIDFQIRIYNSWGKEVYQSGDPAFTWDGTTRGKPLPEGVYMIVMDIVGSDWRQYPYRGTLTLVR